MATKSTKKQISKKPAGKAKAASEPKAVAKAIKAQTAKARPLGARAAIEAAAAQGKIPTETARNQALVVLGIAWGLAAARRKSWWP